MSITHSIFQNTTYYKNASNCLFNILLQNLHLHSAHYVHYSYSEDHLFDVLSPH